MKTMTNLFAAAALTSLFALAGCPKKAPDDKKVDPQTKVIDEAKPTEAKPTEAKPTEAKPDETKPTEVKPTEAKPDEAKPAAKADEKPAAKADIPAAK